jgi:hypothetical protein
MTKEWVVDGLLSWGFLFLSVWVLDWLGVIGQW